AILIGQGARNAADEIEQVAELLGAGIAKALLGKDVLPDDLPNVTGSIGLLGTRPSYELMMECDTLLMVGSSFPYSQFLPKPGQAAGVQIDIDARMIGLRYPMDVNLVGESKRTLQGLIPLLKNKQSRAWEEKIKKSIVDWWDLLEARSENVAQPLNPQYLFQELSPRLPDGAVITCDSGSGTNWYARQLKIRRGMRSTLAGTLATMGCSMPYAVAAKFTHPDRPVVAVVGDGAMQMNGMNELLTVKKYWQEWKNSQFVVVVLHNNDLSQVTWELRVMSGDPKFETSQSLPDFDYAGYGEMLGLAGVHIKNREDVVPGLDQAFSEKRPVVIDAYTDPDVPPLPPHVTIDQARSMMMSLLKGEPNAADVIRQSWKGKIEEFLS
ncbi:MAG: hypothetical protein KDD44_12435, partial [Bdellovibrionales bacterium]|nr:hypothetical protein [Bdellovibrionales bacterium]